MRAIVRRTAILLFSAGLIAGAGAASGATDDALTAPEMAMGNPKAKVTVIEWASVTCPHCAHFNTDIFPAFKKKYVDTGQVRYVMREFLTAPPQLAAAGFVMARCAGSDKYFSVVDAVFRSQEQMFTGGDVKGVLFGIGKNAGLSEDQINACFANPAAVKALNERVEKAINVDKVEATPTFDINGTRLEGVQSLAQLDAVIQPLLKK